MSEREKFSFPLLDLTRATAAMWVLLCHITLLMGKTIFLIGQGGIAVDVFIVVSGLLMYSIIAAQKSLNWQMAAKFYVRRFFRIAPVFYFSLVVYILGRQFYHDGLAEVERLFNSKFPISQLAADPVYWWDVLANLFFVHGLDTWAAVKIVAPAWSLSLEMQFYAVAPVLLYFFRKRPWATLLVAFLFNAVGNYFFGVYDRAGLLMQFHYLHPSFLGNRLFLFMLGASCCRCLLDLNRKELTLLLACVLGCLPLFSGKSMTICIPVVAFFVFARRFPKFSLVRLMEWISETRFVKLMAEYSYSIYLMHMFWLAVAIAILRPWMPVEDAGLKEAIIYTVVCIVLSIATAIPVFYVIERPAREWGKVFARRMFEKKKREVVAPLNQVQEQ